MFYELPERSLDETVNDGLRAYLKGIIQTFVASYAFNMHLSPISIFYNVTTS